MGCVFREAGTFIKIIYDFSKLLQRDGVYLLTTRREPLHLYSRIALTHTQEDTLGDRECLKLVWDLVVTIFLQADKPTRAVVQQNVTLRYKDILAQLNVRIQVVF